MRRGIVADLIAHSRFNRKFSAVREFGFKLAFKTENDVTFIAPMICQIAWGLFDQPNANVAEVLSAPVRRASFAFVFGRFNLRPVRGFKWNVCDFHDQNLKPVNEENCKKPLLI